MQLVWPRISGEKKASHSHIEKKIGEFWWWGVHFFGRRSYLFDLLASRVLEMVSCEQYFSYSGSHSLEENRICEPCFIPRSRWIVILALTQDKPL